MIPWMLTRMSFHSATILIYFSFRLWPFLRTIILLWCSKIHIGQYYRQNTKVYLNYEVSMKIRSFCGKNGSSYIFTLSGILPIPKLFIKAIRGLQALKVLNFQSSGFLNELQYTERQNHLQIWPGIKVWSWY